MGVAVLRCRSIGRPIEYRDRRVGCHRHPGTAVCLRAVLTLSCLRAAVGERAPPLPSPSPQPLVGTSVGDMIWNERMRTSSDGAVTNGQPSGRRVFQRRKENRPPDLRATVRRKARGLQLKRRPSAQRDGGDARCLLRNDFADDRIPGNLANDEQSSGCLGVGEEEQVEFGDGG